MMRHQASSFRRFAPALLAVLTTATSNACHRVPLTAPSGSAISLVGSPNVSVNGQLEISAVVIEGSSSTSGSTSSTNAGGGTPVHDGTVVTFTTTLGRMEPAEAETKNGRATVKLITDARSGVATIVAFSGGAKSEALDVNVGAAAATQLSVTASPQTLPGTGGSSTIAAKVEDLQGNGLPGVAVSFTTTKGNLSATSGVTDDQGISTTKLTTSQAATVTALTGGGTAALSGTVDVGLKPRTTVSITAPASAIVAVPASFTITPGTDAIITNVSVDFGDGSSPATLGAITGATALSHPFRSQGVATVRATATDSDGGTGVAQTQVAVSNLVVALTYSPASPTPGAPVTFTATPSSGALVDRFDWDFGDGVTGTTTANQAVHAFGTGRFVVTLRTTPFNNGTPVQTLVFVDVK